MRRTFVETSVFLEEWRSAGLGDDDMMELQDDLLEDPKRGDVVTGACGIRKLRVALPGMGRRGGGRVIYKDYPEYHHLILFYFYRKGDQVDLTKDEKRAICKALSDLEPVFKKLSGHRGKQ